MQLALLRESALFKLVELFRVSDNAVRCNVYPAAVELWNLTDDDFSAAGEVRRGGFGG